jgi:hypothetical protein
MMGTDARVDRLRRVNDAAELSSAHAQPFIAQYGPVSRGNSRGMLALPTARGVAMPARYHTHGEP